MKVYCAIPMASHAAVRSAVPWELIQEHVRQYPWEYRVLPFFDAILRKYPREYRDVFALSAFVQLTIRHRHVGMACT